MQLVYSVASANWMLYHSKEEIYSEIDLTIYKLKWYSPTNIISLTLLELYLKLVFRYWLCLRNTMSFIPKIYQKSRGTSHFTTLDYKDIKRNTMAMLHIIKRGILEELSLIEIAQSVVAVKYIDCFSAKKIPSNEYPGYDTKQSDIEVPVMVELWEMYSTLSLTSLPGQLRSGVVAPDKSPIYGLNRSKSWFEFIVFCL